MDNLSNNLFKRNLTFLQRISDAVPNECIALRSFYSSKLQILKELSNTTVKAGKSRTREQCPRCCLPFTEGPASYSLKPELKIFSRRVLKKVQEKKPLTSYQKLHLKKIGPAKLNSNYLATKCSFCQKESLKPIQKPEVKKKRKILKPKIKKKKKDKFCGLQAEAVLSVQPGQSKQIMNTVVGKRVIEHKITKKKLKKDQQKKLKNLGDLFSRDATNKQKPANKLSQFLNSL